MDILNNIWIAISTPNEAFCKVILSPLMFLEISLSLQLFTLSLNLKPTKQQKTTYIILVSILSIVTSNLIPAPINVIINYLIFFITILTIFRLNIFKTIIATALPAIVFALVGSLILGPYMSILHIGEIEITSVLIYRLPFILIQYLLIMILIVIIRYTKFTINILDDFDKKDKFVIAMNFVLGILSLIVQFSLISYSLDNLPLLFTFFNFICLLLYFSVSIYSLTKVINLHNTKSKLENEEAYNKTLRILHDNVRGFKHDFDNIVTTIGGYVKTKDIDGLEKYYSQLQDDCQKVNNLYILNPEIINNPGIYNLLTVKYHEAEEKNIKVNLSFLLDLNDLHMKIYDFARMLGILLDNAIDASFESDEKIINIDFRNDAKNNRNIVLIENTYKDKDVNLDKIFDKGVTGKENHTGLGLWEIRKILKKNNNINLHTTKNDEYFSQQLEIYY